MKDEARKKITLMYILEIISKERKIVIRTDAIAAIDLESDTIWLFLKMGKVLEIKDLDRKAINDILTKYANSLSLS